MTVCDHCGGSGVLNVESTLDPVNGPWEPTAAACHACPAGRTWKEVGLDA